MKIFWWGWTLWLQLNFRFQQIFLNGLITFYKKALIITKTFYFNLDKSNFFLNYQVQIFYFYFPFSSFFSTNIDSTAYHSSIFELQKNYRKFYSILHRSLKKVNTNKWHLLIFIFRTTYGCSGRGKRRFLFSFYFFFISSRYQT